MVEYDEAYRILVAQERIKREIHKERKRLERQNATDDGDAPAIEPGTIFSIQDENPVADTEPAPPTRLPPIWVVRDGGGSG